jgi:lysozyme
MDAMTVRHRSAGLAGSMRHRRGRARGAAAVLLGLALAAGASLAPAAPLASAAETVDYVTNCDGVNVRSSASTSSTILDSLPINTVVTTTGTVSGGAWSASCPDSVSGSTWFAISAVNGRSVSSLYGVSVAYAATGLFRRSTYLEGIDVSAWQRTIDWAKVKAAGKRFAIAKATEGIGFRDSYYSANKSGAMGVGIAFTAYHYARPDLNPTRAAGEADWFVDTIGLQPGMLAPALDLEVHGGMSVGALQEWVATWLGRVYARTGVRPMIYTSPAFWKRYLGDTRRFADEGYEILWVAHWGVSEPWVPASNWGGRGWTFWQYTSDGRVQGIEGRVDLDRYNGTDLTRVTYGADFQLSAAPSSAAIKQGASGTFTIAIDRTFFTLPVALTVSGLPAGAGAALSPSNATGSSAKLTVTTSKSDTVTPPGSYPLTVTGTANGSTRTAMATLVVTDGIPPTVTAPVSRLYAVTTHTRVKTSWSAADPSGIASYKLQRQVDAGTWTTVTLDAATDTVLREALKSGSTVRYRVRATDGNGNTSSYVYGPTFLPRRVQQTSTAVSWGGTWKNASDPSYSGGSVRYSTSAGAWASYTFTGSAVAWVAERGPTRGSARVYVDGVYKKTVDLYYPTYQSKRIVYAINWSANGTHTIRIVVEGTAGHPRVDVDAFVRLVRL